MIDESHFRIYDVVLGRRNWVFIMYYY